MDVLFLSVSIGAGHIKAAEALKEALLQKYPNSRCLIVDTLKYVNPIIDKLVVGSYLRTVKATPVIYGKLYEMSRTGYNFNDLSKTFNRLLFRKIKTLIAQFQPSVIVCTHPFPLQTVSTLKKKNMVSVPLVAVLTDFVVHSLWLHDHVDAYIVAHEYMKVQMIKRGIPEETVFPVGIPISVRFLQKKDRKTVLDELGLDDKPTILVMGGSLGFGQIKHIFLSLLKNSNDLQLIVLTGKNRKLKEQLEKYSFDAVKKVKILGYTNDVPELMDAADFIITKPGGMTVAESLAKELPIFIMSPIPGQEEGNANFLVNHGAACRIYDGDPTDDIIYLITHNPLRLKHMREMARYIAKPRSSQEAIEIIEGLCRQQ